MKIYNLHRADTKEIVNRVATEFDDLRPLDDNEDALIFEKLKKALFNLNYRDTAVKDGGSCKPQRARLKEQIKNGWYITDNDSGEVVDHD